MSGSNTGQTPTNNPSTPADPGPHINGYLVYTGQYATDRVNRLYIHTSSPVTMEHQRLVYSYDQHMQTINGQYRESAHIRIEEHGWFRDIAILEQICNNHPTPNGGTPNSLINWRDSLLNFLDIYHSGGLWSRVN
jgi:hypothetical protein